MAIEVLTSVMLAAARSEVVKAIGKSAAESIKRSGAESIRKVLADQGITFPTLADARIENIADAHKVEEIVKLSVPSQTKEEAITISALIELHDSTSRLRDERMRQAKVAFNAAVIFMIAGIIIILAGIILMFFKENFPAGAVTTSVGALAEIASALLFRLNSEANSRLDEIGKHLNRMEAAQIAISIAAKIEDKVKRDEAIREAAVALQGSGSQ